MVKQKNINENDIPINALPKYKIRTMKDDLAELGMEELEKETKEVKKTKKAKKIEPPKELPIAPEPEIEKTVLPKVPLPPPILPTPVRLELKIEPKPKTKKPKKIPLPPLPPKPSPPLIEKPFKRVELPRPEITPAPKPALEKPKKEAPKPEIKLEIPKKLKTKTKSKLLPVLVIIVLILIGVGAFFYWQGTKIEPEPEPKPEPPKPSESLISVEETEIISLTSEISLFETLKQETQLDQPNKTFKRIAILKSSLESGQAEFLSLNEFFKELRITVPPYALAELKDSYTLVIYSQNNERRLGLIIETKNIDNLKQQLGFWEQTMVNDLKNLLLDKNGSQAATAGFQDNIYKGTVIRYINFPEPDLTIDYAIKNNLFILTTSKESMYMIIDRIVDNL